jgi:hypothetical protein
MQFAHNGYYKGSNPLGLINCFLFSKEPVSGHTYLVISLIYIVIFYA